MHREPPPVKHCTRERPSDLPPPYPRKDLVLKLPAVGTEGQKRKKTDLRTKPVHVYPMIPSCQSCPGCTSYAPLPAIIHHTVTHGARGESTAHVSLLYTGFLEQAQRPLHNQRVLLCPKYLICINFIVADLSYLHWIDLLWITRIVPQI